MVFSGRNESNNNHISTQRFNICFSTTTKKKKIIFVMSKFSVDSVVELSLQPEISQVKLKPNNSVPSKCRCQLIMNIHHDILKKQKWYLGKASTIHTSVAHDLVPEKRIMTPLQPHLRSTNEQHIFVLTYVIKTTSEHEQCHCFHFSPETTVLIDGLCEESDDFCEALKNIESSLSKSNLENKIQTSLIISFS